MARYKVVISNIETGEIKTKAEGEVVVVTVIKFNEQSNMGKAKLFSRYGINGRDEELNLLGYLMWWAKIVPGVFQMMRFPTAIMNRLRALSKILDTLTEQSRKIFIRNEVKNQNIEMIRRLSVGFSLDTQYQRDLQKV